MLIVLEAGGFFLFQFAIIRTLVPLSQGTDYNCFFSDDELVIFSLLIDRETIEAKAAAIMQHPAANQQAPSIPNSSKTFPPIIGDTIPVKDLLAWLRAIAVPASPFSTTRLISAPETVYSKVEKMPTGIETAMISEYVLVKEYPT
mmetsp:Transcript_11989/g.13957  ORF Transcript_11989/g.13957 Transcript_11989/m.13957 type:complete len:145 (-) Transcript_11989:336-770(-)